MIPRSRWVAHAAVLVAAVIFGSTFVVVQHGIKHARPVPFLAARFLIGAVVLAAVGRRRREVPRPPRVASAGLVAGTLLLGGYLLQTIGLQYTSTSVSAFVTYLLVVLVPLLSALALRRMPSSSTLVGVGLATVGLFLLTGKGAGLGRGELLTMGCALCFALHILVLADLAPRFDTLRLNAIQLAVVGAACLLPGIWLGGYHWPLSTWLAATYTGVMASALALGLQMWGQRQVGPTRTSLLLMIEPVSAAIIGVIIGEHLGWAGAAGAGLILAGIAVAELRPLLPRRNADSCAMLAVADATRSA